MLAACPPAGAKTNAGQPLLTQSTLPLLILARTGAYTVGSLGAVTMAYWDPKFPGGICKAGFDEQQGSFQRLAERQLFSLDLLWRAWGSKRNVGPSCSPQQPKCFIDFRLVCFHLSHSGDVSDGGPHAAAPTMVGP